MFREISGLDLSWKEKYGTLRYEWFLNPKVEEEDPENNIYRLMHVDKTNEDFIFSVALAVCDYPDMAREILSDFLFHNKWEQIDKHRASKKYCKFCELDVRQGSHATTCTRYGGTPDELE